MCSRNATLGDFNFILDVLRKKKFNTSAYITCKVSHGNILADFTAWADAASAEIKVIRTRMCIAGVYSTLLLYSCYQLFFFSLAGLSLPGLSFFSFLSFLMIFPSSPNTASHFSWSFFRSIS
jgi:hypothetical protein